LKIKNTKKI